MTSSAQPQHGVASWITSAITDLVLVSVALIGLIDIAEYLLPRVQNLYHDVNRSNPQVFLVTDQLGTLVPAFPLILESKGREPVVLLTNEKGLATVARLDPGEYELSLPDDEPRRPRAITIEKGKSAVIAVTVSDHSSEVVKVEAKPPKRIVETVRKAAKQVHKTRGKGRSSASSVAAEPIGMN